MKISAVSIVCNMLLTAFKLIAGFVANSAALIADAVHSASDVLGSLIVMIGAVFSHKAPDESHPYGHEKMECIASILLGNILFLVAIAIGYSGIEKIISGTAIKVPGSLALVAAAVSIVVKEALYWYTIIGARKINSVSLKAEAWHHRSDALSSIGSFAGVLGARLGYPILDPIAAIVISLFILKVAFSIFKESIDRLVDHSCGEVETDKMVDALKTVPGILGVDDIKTRLFGSRTYVDVEIRADGEQKLVEAHAIAEDAHHKLEEEFPDVKHCTVHVNPVEPND